MSDHVDRQGFAQIMSSPQFSSVEKMEAFWNWLESNGQGVKAYIRRRVPSEWEDALQDVVYAVCKNLNDKAYTYRDDIPFEAYVTAIARNIVARIIKKDLIPSNITESIDERYDLQSFEKSFDRIMDEDEVVRIILTLPADNQVIIIRLIQGFTLEEIANEMNLSYNAVKTRKSRILDDLRGKFVA